MKKVFLFIALIAIVVGCSKVSKNDLVNTKWQCPPYALEFAPGGKAFLYKLNKEFEYTSLSSSGTFKVKKDTVYFDGLSCYQRNVELSVVKGIVEWNFMTVSLEYFSGDPFDMNMTFKKVE